LKWLSFIIARPPATLLFPYTTLFRSENAVLPRGVTREEFDRAIEKFRALLGDENVLVEPERLLPYNKIMLSVENAAHAPSAALRSEEHTSELQSRENLVCRLLLETKK